MFHLFGTVVALLFLTEVTQAAPKNCCYPAQWESLNFIQQGGLSPDGTVVFTEGEEMISVDSDALMVNSMASLTTGGETTSLRTIQDFKNGKQYQIIAANCTITSLGAFNNKCVPDEAKYLTTDVFGVGKNQLSVDIYGITQGNVTVYLDVAKPDCTPMAVTSYGTTAQGTGLSSKVYSNFTVGIKDRSVFNIPLICQKTVTQETEQHHGMGSSESEDSSSHQRTRSKRHSLGTKSKSSETICTIDDGNS